MHGHGRRHLRGTGHGPDTGPAVEELHPPRDTRGGLRRGRDHPRPAGQRRHPGDDAGRRRVRRVGRAPPGRWDPRNRGVRRRACGPR